MARAKNLYNWFVRNPHATIVSYLVVAYAFILIGHKFQVIQKCLQYVLFSPLPSVNVDIWSITHILLYLCIGFLKPNKALEFMFLGIGFEVFEDYMASNKVTQLVNCYQGKMSFWCNNTDLLNYWYAGFTDVFFNMLGYTIGEFFGRFVRSHYPPGHEKIKVI